jgi:HAD superfamily hydrolase (TIGR01484 family)
MPVARLLALDLDGTLLRDDGTIDPRDAEAVTRARAAGCAVTLATGRMTAATLHVAHALGLDTPLVCGDGRVVAHPQSGASIELFAVPRRAEAIVIMREHRLSPLQITPAVVVHESTIAHAHIFTSVWERVTVATALERAPGADAVIVLGLGDLADTMRAHEALATRLGESVAIDGFAIDGGPHVVRARAPGHDKQTALERVARAIGVARDDVAAVGDWYNDIGMLRWAGRSFAMGGSPAQVCAAAGDVLEAPIGRGGGVAEAVARWLG